MMIYKTEAIQLTATAFCTDKIIYVILQSCGCCLKVVDESDCILYCLKATNECINVIQNYPVLSSLITSTFR